MPDPSTPSEFPSYQSDEDLPEGILSFHQILPYQEPDKYDPVKGHPKDKAFRLTARVSSSLEKTTRINWDGNPEKMRNLEGSFVSKENFVGSVSFEEGLNSKVSQDPPVSDTSLQLRICSFT